MIGGSSQLPTTDEPGNQLVLHNSDNQQSSAVVVNWEDPPNIWLTAAKNPFVGRPFKFRVHMLLKSAVKNSLSTRRVFKSNSPVDRHVMVSGFTLEKLKPYTLCCHIGLLFSKRVDVIMLSHRIWKYLDSWSTRYWIPSFIQLFSIFSSFFFGSYQTLFR